jgi:hypothetical protein
MKSSSVSQWARLLVTAFFTFSLNGFAQVLFEDNFNTDTSANWTVLSGTNADENDAAYDAALGDFTVDFAFDYSTRGIPPAPNNGDNSTRGVKISVNNNDNTAGSEGMGETFFQRSRVSAATTLYEWTCGSITTGRPVVAPAPRNTLFSE